MNNGSAILGRLDAMEADLSAKRRALRSLQLEIGALLGRMRRERVHRERGCDSFRHYAETRGFAVGEAYDLMAARAAAECDERVARYLVAGRLSLRAAANLDRALRLPPDPEAPARDWVELAVRTTSAAFREEVSAAAARAAQPLPPTRLVIWASDDTRRVFRRARRVAMRSTRRVLTDGEALGEISRFYLERRDRRWQLARTLRRRAPALRAGGGTRAGLPTRRVSAYVEREVVARDRDTCVVGLCPNEAFLDLGHLYVAHAEGGEASVGNLGVQCHGHNLMQQEGLITVVRHASGPIVLDRHGFVVERERRPDEPRRTLAEMLEQLDDRCVTPKELAPT